MISDAWVHLSPTFISDCSANAPKASEPGEQMFVFSFLLLHPLLFHLPLRCCFFLLIYPLLYHPSHASSFDFSSSSSSYFFVLIFFLISLFPSSSASSSSSSSIIFVFLAAHPPPSSCCVMLCYSSPFFCLFTPFFYRSHPFLAFKHRRTCEIQARVQIPLWQVDIVTAFAPSTHHWVGFQQTWHNFQLMR